MSSHNIPSHFYNTLVPYTHTLHMHTNTNIIYIPLSPPHTRTHTHTQADDPDDEDLMQNPEFLHSVLSSLPGVNPEEALHNLEQMTDQGDKSKVGVVHGRG